MLVEEKNSTIVIQSESGETIFKGSIVRLVQLLKDTRNIADNIQADIDGGSISEDNDAIAFDNYQEFATAYSDVVIDEASDLTIIANAKEILSDVEFDKDCITAILTIANNATQDELIDYVDGVIVWVGRENELTCEDFLYEIGYYDGFGL
jgi:hypothetical protein